MVRHVALSSVALAALLSAFAACVGDDPANPSAASDAGGTPDASAPAADSAATNDGSTTSDTGNGTDADGALPCLTSPSGLVSWWTGDSSFIDHEAKNTLVLAGSANGVTHAPGEVGNAFSFDGTAHLERSGAVGLDNMTGITVEGWVKATSADNGRILDRSTAGTNDGWLFDVYLTKLRIIVGAQSVSAKGQFPVGVMKHVASTYDGTTLRLYIDGAEENAFEPTVAPAIPSPALPVRLGGASDNSARWKGLIDELAVYSRALSPLEIKAIHDAGAGGRCK